MLAQRQSGISNHLPQKGPMTYRNPSARGVVRLCCLFAILLIPAAGAGADPPADKRAGIDRATNAGIVIDAAAEPLMESAPLGSCFNDPTQAPCPKVKRIAKARTWDLQDGSLAYGPEEPTAMPARARAAAVPQCFLKVDYPYYASGWAWGQGANTCTAAASEQELHVSLDRTTDGVWYGAEQIKMDYLTCP